MQQTLLDLFDNTPTFNNFMPLNNEIIVAMLQSCASQFTHLSSAHLCGKTHLLKAWVHSAITQHKTAIYLDSHNLQFDLHDIVEQYRFIAIDNIEILDNDKQIALFNLFNQIKLNNTPNYLLTSSSNILEYCDMREDLKTRLLSGLNLNIKHLNDADLIQAIQIHTRKEGINLAEAELNYLANHHTRNIGLLINIIHLVARQALTERRNITIPLIKQVLEQNIDKEI